MFVLDSRDGGHVMSLAFAPDPGTLYVSRCGRVVHVWNLPDRAMREFQIPDTTTFAEFELAPGGRWAHGYSNWQPRLQRERGEAICYFVVDLATGATYPFQTNRHPCGAAATPEGSRLLSIENLRGDKIRPQAPNTCIYRVYGRAVTGTGLQYEWHRDFPVGTFAEMVAALGADRFAVLERRVLSDREHDKRITIRRTGEGEPERILDCPSWSFDQLLASPDGSKLVLRRGTELLVWDATDWEHPPVTVAGKPKGSMDPPAAAFTPSGEFLLLANGGPSVFVFEAATWKQVRKWKWDAGGVLRAVAVSPDGTLAAAGGTRGAVVVWDLDL